MITALLAAVLATSFVSALVLLRWALAECGTAPLTEAYEHSEAQGPAGFWPRLMRRSAPEPAAKPGPETAVVLFKEGCPCHMALLEVYGPALGMSRGEAFETQLELAQQMDLHHMCGAAVCGLTLLKAQADRERKAEPGPRGKPESDPKGVFIHDFAERWGSLSCKGILGCDLQTPEGREKARAERLVERLCPEIIKETAKLTARLLGNGHWARPEHRTLHKDVGLHFGDAAPAPCPG